MKDIIKIVVSVALTWGIRAVRVIPNNDPIAAMLVHRPNTLWKVVVFPMVAMASFDALSGRIGMWTIVTTMTYGAVGFGIWVLHRVWPLESWYRRVSAGVMAVLAFDLVTGPIMSSLLFSMPFSVSFMGQIPFTLVHLGTVTGFVCIGEFVRIGIHAVRREAVSDLFS